MVGPTHYLGELWFVTFLSLLNKIEGKKDMFTSYTQTTQVYYVMISHNKTKFKKHKQSMWYGNHRKQASVCSKITPRFIRTTDWAFRVKN